MGERPSWTISRAADECGVSRDTIKRHRAAGDFPNATQNSRGHWSIPIDDLIAAGLQPGKPRTGADVHQGKPPVHQGSAPVQSSDAPGARTSAAPDEAAELRTQIELLQVRLDAESRLRIAAEQNAADLRTSLRMLESGPSANPAPAPGRVDNAPGAARPDSKRARWWRR